MQQNTVTPGVTQRVGQSHPIDNANKSSTAQALAEIKATEPRLGWPIWLGTLTINLLSLALPLTILQAYDRILPNGALDTFTLMVLVATAAILLEMLMRMARIAVLGRLTAVFEYRMITAAVGHILAAPVPAIAQLPAGTLLDKIQSIDFLRSHHTGQSRLALIDLPFACLFLFLMYMIGGNVVIVPLLLMIALAPLNMRHVSVEEAVTIRRRKDEDRRTDLLIEILRGIRTLKILSAEALMMRRHDRLQQTTVENSYNSLLIANSNQSLSTLFTNLVLVLTVAYGAYLVIEGAISVGSLAACTTLAGRAVQPILRLFTVHGQMVMNETARQRLADVLALPRENYAESNQSVRLRGAVSLTNLGFHYPNSTQILFNSLNLIVPSGSICGITGLDLAGKSTLARLIAGEIAPTTGTIHIDDYDLNGPCNAALRSRIALVSQEQTLFDGTILDNIAMFRRTGSVEDALKAARLIGLELDIQRLPHGYETYISDSIADELPASFAQRIMIARALGRRPKILILDQANAVLDMRSERFLREALLAIKGSVTVFLTTERPSLLRIADSVHVLSAGQLLAMPPSPDATSRETGNMRHA
jgi:ATP-binding cassette, subfamily C, bacterial LapB